MRNGLIRNKVRVRRSALRVPSESRSRPAGSLATGPLRRVPERGSLSAAGPFRTRVPGRGSLPDAGPCRARVPGRGSLGAGPFRPRPDVGENPPHGQDERGGGRPIARPIATGHEGANLGNHWRTGIDVGARRGSRVPGPGRKARGGVRQGSGPARGGGRTAAVDGRFRPGAWSGTRTRPAGCARPGRARTRRGGCARGGSARGAKG